MNTNKIKRVLILGAGTMGLQIGLTCAAAGFEVTIYDVMDKVLKQGRIRIKELADRLVALNRMDSDKAETGLMKVSFSCDPGLSGRNADFVSESVPEDPGLKQKVFSQFNEICPDHAIFTTNSSTLLPSQIAESTGRPDRFAALHFHDCSLTNVVDIMPHPGTSEQTISTILDFCRAIDQYPIELKKEQHGYVFNTMLTELLAAALSLASKQVASPEDIDRAWMGIMKTSVGPFGIMDSVGLETVYKITDYWACKLDDPKRKANAEYLKNFVEKGDLGVKTGRGFYEYPEPAFLQPDFMKGIH
jgi:3-hydroxybutyryl-CoA dehydrogenase